MPINARYLAVLYMLMASRKDWQLVFWDLDMKTMIHLHTLECGAFVTVYSDFWNVHENSWHLVYSVNGRSGK